MNSAQPIHPNHYVDDRPQEGIFRVHKNVYADPQVFELEIEHIFNKTYFNNGRHEIYLLFKCIDICH